MKPINSDVIIIGGGIVGSSAALFMSQKGLKVTLLERDTCGSRSSGVNFGGVRCQGRPVTHLPLAIKAREIWQNLENLLGGRYEYSTTGHLKLARNENDMIILNDYYQKSFNSGLDLEMLSGEQIRKRYPWISKQIVGGSFSPHDGQANPRILSPAFAAAAAKKGANVVERNPVKHIEYNDSYYQVTTEFGLYQAEQLVICAGAWSNNLAEQLDEKFPLERGCPAMAVTEPIPHFIEPCLGVQGGDIYCRQVTRGNVVFGGGRGIGIGESSSRATGTNLINLMHHLLALIPSLKNTQILRTWSGMEGFLPDHAPIIGQSKKHHGLFYGFGFSGGGFEIGPGAGAALTDLVSEGKSTFDINPFQIDRFL
ncbi:NAD(P)/FAD-dependent oxidoreductase [Vibrio salinus]|uniref:NAD(P)/FAD-dependent oxidoreductase n=1 Tax=Vibrio salinus TaxID=2899784 RepID=UPI001E4E7D93|nr:FAD-binding oxidoreductase [Vibrio salinus]MCE0495262.1 FAD-binding oxidoreductase [Vibrio salinus]